MDRFIRIYSILFLLVFIFIATGCSKQKEGVSKVFPEAMGDCVKSAHKTRYLAKKKNGKIEKVYAESREKLIEDYVTPNLQDLEFVESDQIITTNDLVPGEISTSAIETWGTERIQADVAWNNGVRGQGVTVAVIDSGVEITHPSLSSEIYVNQSEAYGFPGYDDDQNGFDDDTRGWNFVNETPYNSDTSGHGTHVSGIIAGSHSGPMKGVAPDAKILPLDFMGKESGYTSDAIEAIEYAKKMKARVINASWGSGFCSKLLNETIDSLLEKNILFVAAAGNSGNNLSYYPEFPAAFISPAQVTVGSITRFGYMSSFSNYGPLVDVMAPGDDILSSYINGDYMSLSGTSMAAPFVSGLAALLVSAKPEITVAQLKDIILKSVRKGNYAVKTQGEINVPQALGLLHNP